MHKLGFICLTLILWACQSQQGEEDFESRLDRIERGFRMKLSDKQHDSLPALPSVGFNTHLEANARFENDTIWVGQLQQAFQSDDAIASLLYHEYQHFLFARNKEFPVKFDSAGKIVQWKTGEWFTYVPNQYRIEQSLLYFQDSVLPTYGELTETERQRHLDEMRQTVAQPQELPFTYAPSNLSLEEIAAYEAQLAGESLGLYHLSPAARADILDRLELQKDTYKRRKAYEAAQGLNPDGSSRSPK